MKTYIGIVLDNNDPDKQGKIQFKIEYLMRNWETDKYPWAKPAPLSTGGSNEHGVSCIPEIGSHCRFIFEDERNWKKAYYINDVHFAQKHPHELYETNVKSEVSGSANYPDVKFLYTKNGICIALSSNDSNPEITIYHPEGSYIHVNSSGNIEIKAGTATLEKSVLGETLKMWLESHTHSTGVGPSGTPIQVAQLSTILSQKIKNN